MDRCTAALHLPGPQGARRARTSRSATDPLDRYDGGVCCVGFPECHLLPACTTAYRRVTSGCSDVPLASQDYPLFLRYQPLPQRSSWRTVSHSRCGGAPVTGHTRRWTPSRFRDVAAHASAPRSTSQVAAHSASHLTKQAFDNARRCSMRMGFQEGRCRARHKNDELTCPSA